MKKKGFTLIEILSVIIILGVIFLFITPKISNLIKDSRNLSKEINEITIINSVKEYATINEKNFYSSFYSVGDKGYILVSDIISKGNISKEEIEDYGVIDTDYVEVELVENDKFIYKFVSNMDTITVKFDLNDGVMEDKYIKVRYNETYGELPIPVKNGYTFAGWYKEKELNNKVVSSTIVKDKKTHVLYAKWIEIIKLEVDLNGGSTTQDFEEKYAPNTEIKLISPTKKGYTFTGWQIVSGDSILSGNNLTIGSVNTIIKATYSPITYTINYNVVNDSSGNSYPNIGTYDSMLTIKNPSRTGYTFDGWMATNIDTTTAKYGTTSPNTIWNGITKVKDTYFINLRSSVGIVTMNANYTATSQILTVNLNGGTTSQLFNGTYKTNEVITLINPTRAGYTFIGWSVTSGNSILSGNTLTMGSENTTITANWKASMYTVYFNSNGGSAVSNINVTYGETYGTLPVPIRDGYIFLGWYNENYKDYPLNYYADTYADLKAAFGYDQGKLYNHWEAAGVNEGRRISQYISSDRVTITNNITLYAGWVKKVQYLYNLGNEYTDITGGWISTPMYWRTDDPSKDLIVLKGPKITRYSDYMRIEQSGGPWGSSGIVNLAQDVTLTDYKYLHFVVNYTTGNSSQALVILNRNSSYWFSNAIARYEFPAYSNSQNKMQYSIDISSLNGNYDIGFGIDAWSSSATIDVYKVWLEK